MLPFWITCDVEELQRQDQHNRQRDVRDTFGQSVGLDAVMLKSYSTPQLVA